MTVLRRGNWGKTEGVGVRRAKATEITESRKRRLQRKQGGMQGRASGVTGAVRRARRVEGGKAGVQITDSLGLRPISPPFKVECHRQLLKLYLAPDQE